MSKKLTGEIQITNSGVGYFPHEDLNEDVKIEPKFLNTALNGDVVEVIAFPKKKGKQRKGKVVNIVSRAQTKFVGVLDKKGKNYSFLLPDDEKMYTDIFIPDPSGDHKDGWKALVELVEWENQKESPEGRLVKLIGEKGTEETEREAIILKSGLDSTFRPEVKREAEKLEETRISESEYERRKDFTDRRTFTIDPESAKDFDDALSIRKKSDDLYEVGIHIADVSFYVDKNSKIDKEAKERAFSIYMVGQTVPMLPEALSNNLCSLNPNEEKLAFSVVFDITSEGKVKDSWVGETIIESDTRYTYKEAMKKIEEGDEDLQVLNEMAKTRREKRIKNGSLKFREEEVIFDLREDGTPRDVKRKEVLDTHRLIEEFMLLANTEVAKKFDSSPFLFRVHEEPEKEVIRELKDFLSGLGYDVDLGGKIDSKKINELFEKVEGEPVEFLVNETILKSMTKAYYSTSNEGHFGLNFDKYTHFTSPIRRYADLTVHRLIKTKLKGGKLGPESDYKKLAKQISEREISVQEAERESIGYKKCQYMLDKVGDIREAVISGITDWGIYARDIESFAEGMIPLHSLEDDYYKLDEENYRLIGKNTNKEYSLGDEVKVKVESVDLDQNMIDFELV